jgi:hypothetical protein
MAAAAGYGSGSLLAETLGVADLGSAGFEVRGDLLVILRDTKQQGF